MSGDTFPRQTDTLSSQLIRRVILLSLIAILGLVAAVVVSLGASLQVTQGQLSEAGSTAARAFDEFLSSIEGDLLATSGALATTRDMGEVLRRTLNRQPAIFELILVDPQGEVLAQRRRVGEAEPIMAEQPWLATIQAGEVYLGPVDYGEFGVPFANMAVAVTDDAGKFSATLVARVDLTALWDTVIRLRVGKTGYVYITNEAGQLLAYRNLQLVRSGITLKNTVGRTPQAIAEPGINFYTGLGDEKVLASGMPLAVVPWFAIVEQPVGEALRSFAWLSAGLLILLLLAGLLVYNIVLFTRRRIASPLLLLREGVDALRQGNLNYRIDIQTRDELGALADTLNTMAAQLQEMVGTLEQRVADRTRGLQTAAEVARITTSVLDPDQLLRQVVDLVRERFGLYYVGLFLLDEERRFAVLRAGTGQAGQQMMAQGHRLEVGGDSMIGQCTARAEAHIALDVGEEAVRFDNPLLPETHSEMALPLRSRGRVIGAMTVQSVKEAAFDEADIAVMQTMADQVAVAIDNARLFADTQAALKEMETTQRRYLGQVWAEYAHARAVSGYEQTTAGLKSLGDEVLPEALHAVMERRPVIWSSDGESQGEGSSLPSGPLPEGSGEPSALVAPILLRGQPIGVMGFKEEGRQWTEDEIDLVKEVTEQLALAADNLRLLDETQRGAARERLTSEITARMRETLDMDTVLQTAVRRMREALNLEEVEVRMGPGLAPEEGGGADDRSTP